MKNKICLLCKKNFQASNAQKFCSEDCRKKYKNQYFKKWVENNSNRMQELKAAEYIRHRERYIKNTKKWQLNIKIDILLHYSDSDSPTCNCCGEKNIKFLTIDHIDGNGSEDRKKHGFGNNFYRWLQNNNYPLGYQVLCYNCNCGRGKNNGICPHKDVI